MFERLVNYNSLRNLIAQIFSILQTNYEVASSGMTLKYLI